MECSKRMESTTHALVCSRHSSSWENSQILKKNSYKDALRIERGNVLMLPTDNPNLNNNPNNNNNKLVFSLFSLNHIENL